jgi:hypothetical protein
MVNPHASRRRRDGWFASCTNASIASTSYLAERPGNQKLKRLSADAPSPRVTHKPIAEIGDPRSAKHEGPAPDRASCVSVLNRKRQSLVAFSATPLPLDKRQTFLISNRIGESGSADKAGVRSCFADER